MKNARKNSYSDLPELEEPKDTQKATKKRDNSTFPFIHLLSRLLQRIQIIALWAAGMLKGLIYPASKSSKRTQIKKGTTIAALVMAAILAGHSVSAQVTTALPPLSQVKIPEPDNIGDFIKDKVSAIALGKSLFWDMQLGSDGIQSCASCHFHAGADSRSKNQNSPGFIDKTFTPGHGPNYQLTATDYPFHQLADSNNKWLYRSPYGDLTLKCQNCRHRNRKFAKLRKPYLSLFISFNLLLIPSTVPLVVLRSK